MRPHPACIVTAAALLTVSPSMAQDAITPVPFTSVRFEGGLLGERQRINREVTLPFALEQLESQNRLKNFDLAAETMRRRAAGETTFQNKPATIYTFDDTDVYKVVEGASYTLSLQPDPGLQERLEGMIRRVAAAQEPDGYLFTFRTMHPDSPAHEWIGAKRWEKDPGLSHELYNLGHLFESGVAHFQATGSRSLLDICLKAADMVDKDLGDGDPRIPPGHQVIEMGLAGLYRKTGDKRWIDLARVFLENRRGTGGAYSQDHLPVLEQSEAVGHAVRANYMYSGMADVAALGGDRRYFDAVLRIWDNVVGRKLHLTGGCGARGAGEAYGDDYELPHNCYNETCAAIAFLFWNHRMFLMTGEAKYMDVFERSMYNGVISGVSLSGDRFFYPNPLVYDGKAKNNHGHAGRAPWFGCACCPPNLLRLLASLGGYAYATRGSGVYVNLYARGKASVDRNGSVVEIAQATNYPWEETIALRISPDKPQTFALHLRIPCWASGRPLPGDLYHYDDPTPAAWTLEVNGKKSEAPVRGGYAVVEREWKPGDEVKLTLPMPVRRVGGNEKIAATLGQVALERGPIVFAFEGIDNENALDDLFLPESAVFEPVWQPDLMGGVTTLAVKNAMRVTPDGEKPAALKGIPYAFWNNRGLSPMRVWFPRDAAGVPPAPKLSLARLARVTSSFARPGMDLANLNDGALPLNATDGFAPHFDFWPHKGSAEWVEYTFPQDTMVQSATVSWFDDSGTGECRVPASWRMLWRTPDGKWEPVQTTDAYATPKRTPVGIRFTPVHTTALRLEIQLPADFSSGLYEWSVE